jgi:hypothetical protein
MAKILICGIVFGTPAAIIAVLLLGWATSAPHLTCAFERNEPGPYGADGQMWWWDIYKCTDGERRLLVAGPRG